MAGDDASQKPVLVSPRPPSLSSQIGVVVFFFFAYLTGFQLYPLPHPILPFCMYPHAFCVSILSSSKRGCNRKFRVFPISLPRSPSFPTSTVRHYAESNKSFPNPLVRNI